MLRRIFRASKITQKVGGTPYLASTRSIKVYTRTGDDGTSALFANGRLVRRAKNDQIFEVLGTLDELNANVGLAAAYANRDPMLDDLADIYTKCEKNRVV